MIARETGADGFASSKSTIAPQYFRVFLRCSTLACQVLTLSLAVTAWSACNSGGILGGGGKVQKLGAVWHTATAANSLNTNWPDGQPSLFGGRVFVEDANTVKALDIGSGAIQWSTRVKTFVTPGANNLPVRDDRVFVSESEGFTALSTSTGEILWKFQPDSNAALIGSSVDDRAFYSGQRGIPIVYAVGVSDGKLLWRANVGPTWTTPAFVTGVSVSGDTVYAAISRWKNQFGGSRSGIIVALDRYTGNEFWRYETPTDRDDFNQRLVVAGSILIGNDLAGGAIIGVNRWTGKEAWRIPATGNGFGSKAPAVLNGDHAYIASNDTYVYDFSASTGQLFWKTSAGGSLRGVTFCGGSVWVMSGQLERRSATDGSLTGAFNPGTQLTSNLATDGSRVYVTGYDGVYAVACQ